VSLEALVTRVTKIICLALLLATAAVVVIVRSKSLVSQCATVLMSRAEAEAIDAKKLQDYCEREGMSAAQFPPPEVHSTKEVPWIFDHTSTTSPRHFVRVHIDECGAVEVSREIYNR